MSELLKEENSKKYEEESKESQDNIQNIQEQDIIVEDKSQEQDNIQGQNKVKNLKGNKILSDDNVDVDITPKVGRNSIVVNLCSCAFTFNISS